MATEVTDKQYNALVAELKKNPGNSERHYAEKSGIAQSQIASVLYKAELEADPKLRIPATGAAVVKARAAGVRWPRIAVYAGITQSRAKELYEEQSGESAAASWTGRGRRHDGTGAPAKTGTSNRRGASAKTQTVGSGRRGAGSKTSGTGGRGKAAPKKTTAASGRRGTRAGANPS